MPADRWNMRQGREVLRRKREWRGPPDHRPVPPTQQGLLQNRDEILMLYLDETHTPRSCRR